MNQTKIGSIAQGKKSSLRASHSDIGKLPDFDESCHQPLEIVEINHLM